MELLEGPPERQRVKNVALMMFCDHPIKPDYYKNQAENDSSRAPNRQ